MADDRGRLGRFQRGILAVKAAKEKLRCPRCGMEFGPGATICACGADVAGVFRRRQRIAFTVVLAIAAFLVIAALAGSGWIEWLSLLYFIAFCVPVLIFLSRKG